MKKSIFFVLLCLLAVNFLGAQDFRKNPPMPGPAPKIQLGNYETFKLDNGLQVIVVENHKLPRVSYSLFVDAGPILEKEVAGAASIAGDLLSKGTTTRKKAEIDADIDFLGASFGTSSSGFYAACLKKHADKVLAIASDVLLNPAFATEELEKIRKKSISSLASQKDNPNAISNNVGKVLRYGAGHPYGEVTTEATIGKITIDNCKSYYNTYFKPNISYLTIVGDITLVEAKAQAAKYFGAWKSGTVSKATFATPKAPGKTEVAFVQKVGAVQSVVDINYPVDLKPNDPNVIKAMMMNRILGAGGFSARLFQNLREKKAYTYGAYSALNTDLVVGEFSANASVRNTVTDSSIMAFLYELNRIRTEKVTDVELNTVKSVATGAFARSLENPRTVASFALNTARYGLPKDYYATYLEKVSKVTPEEILEMAKKYVTPDNAYIVVVGNKDEVAEKLKKFSPDGTVNYYDFYGNRIVEKAPASTGGLTAETVISNYIKALGGKEKLMSIKDVSRNMESEVMGRVMSVEMYQKTPNKSSQNISMAGMVMMKMVFDGEKGTKDLEGDELESMKSNSIMFKELNYFTGKYKVELKGTDDVDGVDAYKIEVVASDGKKTIEYYAKDTFYKLREVKTEGKGDQTTVVTTDFMDYQEVGGVKMPNTMVLSGMMPVPLKMVTKTIKVNSNLDDAVFKM
jgi:zinc protease